jgi:hypothetical protein
MCEECEDAEPFYVAYFGKAGGELWRPRQEGAMARGDQAGVRVVQGRFACDDVRMAAESSPIQRKSR